MNTYRVDVANGARVPCGMCSIRYIGDSYNDAKRAFNRTESGYDNWNNANPAFGVVLSKWSDAKQDYLILACK